MRNLLARAIGGVAIAALAAGLGGGAAEAHHSDWGLPLLGGMVGGAGLTALYMHSQERGGGGGGGERAPAQVVQPVYVAPAATVAPAAPTATSIEDKLNTLDQLAAKGYITPAEYQARRQALLDQL